MDTEWLDPSGAAASVSDTVLRRKHEAAYRYAREYAAGYVVDVACGVGYGARVLGDDSRLYVGLDRSRRAIRTATERNTRRPVCFAVADAAGTLPVASNAAELVLAFQIVEHIPKPETASFLKELRRICGEEGRVIVTTPNRAHRLLPFQPPWNPYHTREFGKDELEEILERVFSSVTVRGLRAEEELEEIELERVRQSPLLVYGGMLLRLLPEVLADWIREIREKIFPANGNEKNASDWALATDEVTVDRFEVVEDPQGKGLDLVAVCRP